MPLDTRAIGEAMRQWPAPPDVLGRLQGGMARAYQLQAAQQTNQANALQLAEAQRQEQERGTLARAFRGAVRTDAATGRATLDAPAAFSAAYQTSMNPLAVLQAETEYGRGQAESRKAGLEAQKAQLEQQQEQLAFVGKVANGVLAAVDDGADPQQAYERGIAVVQQAGLPIQGLPPTFDRSVVLQFAATSQKYQEALQHQQKVLDQQLEAQRLALAGRTERRLERAEGRAETKASREERDAAREVPQYTGDSTLNVAIDRRMKERGLTGPPPGDVLAQSMEDVQQGKVAVSAATGERQAQIEREHKPLDAATKKAVDDITALQAMTDDITDLFDPSYTGQFEGRWGAVKQWAGNASQREVVFRRIVQDMKDQLLRARSGAAITQAEYERLSQIVPNVTDADDTFRAKLLGFRRSLDQAKQAKLESATTGRGALEQQQKPVTPLPGTGGSAAARPLPTTVEEIDREIADIERQLRGR